MSEPQILYGVATGSFSAALFNPYDRALFLSNVHNRPFLNRSNFVSPFQGASKAALQKIVSQGLCFPIEDFTRSKMGHGTSENIASGFFVGSCTALLCNPLSAVTFNAWSAAPGTSMGAIAMNMWNRGGIVPFTRGIRITIARDSIWGAIFTGVRHHAVFKRKNMKESHASFLSNVFAAGLATVISSPLNYVRNIQNGSCGDVPSLKIICTSLSHEMPSNKRERLLFVAQRMNIGWATLRVSIGVAASAQIYYSLSK